MVVAGRIRDENIRSPIGTIAVLIVAVSFSGGNNGQCFPERIPAAFFYFLSKKRDDRINIFHQLFRITENLAVDALQYHR